MKKRQLKKISKEIHKQFRLRRMLKIIGIQCYNAKIFINSNRELYGDAQEKQKWIYDKQNAVKCIQDIEELQKAIETLLYKKKKYKPIRVYKSYYGQLKNEDNEINPYCIIDHPKEECIKIYLDL